MKPILYDDEGRPIRWQTDDGKVRNETNQQIKYMLDGIHRRNVL